MASPIRMVGETDAEYARRLQPLWDFARSPLFQREVQKMIDNNNVFKRHFQLAELRESCGVRAPRGETFKWDVYS